jgi:tRNA A-37 threonylcarbamoyl transferase component Bud32
MSCPRCHQSHLDASCPAEPSLSTPDPRPAGDDELVGRTVGSFRLIRQLGRGGMGTVYLGEHTVIGSRVAIKLLHPHLSLDEQMVNRFRAEARATNLVGHENIVSIFDLGSLPDGRHYMVMEYLEGKPLSSEMLPLAPARAVELLVQMCSALDAAHRVGVIHRDLKPDNVFLVQRRGGEAVKILDFGIAKLLAGDGSSSGTMVGSILGTPEFMSPEQASGGVVDARSDLYALGVIAYQLLTGAPPFTGGWAKVLLAHQTASPIPPDRKRAELPAALSQVVLRAIEKEPKARFASAGEMAEALRGAIEGRAPVAATPPPPANVPASKSTGIPGAPDVAVLMDSGGRRAVRLGELTRGGAYVLLDQRLPRHGERVTLELQLPGGTLVVAGDVVQLVPPEKAREWRMSPGVALQFCESGAAFSRRLEALLKPRDADALARKAEEVFREFRSRTTGTFYALLDVPLDAEFSDIRRAATRAVEKLEQFGKGSLPNDLAERFRALSDRVNKARVALGDPVHRAEYDGSLGNFRGVARCLAAGLRVDELAACRRRVLADRNKPPPATDIRLISARAWVTQNELGRALEELERGLVDDPLHLELHRQHAALKRQLSAKANDRLTGAA